MPTVMFDLSTSPTEIMKKDAKASMRFILISCLRNEGNRAGGFSSMARNSYQH